jgi:ATP-dependent exoDNAse (exonuclease V) beta subunit
LHTPLVFSVHEAKGLEYPHVILYTLVSGQRAAYAEVCEGVRPDDLQVDELNYNRARDKGDKSLELYKFYVNALYVAVTRAVDSLTLVESDTTYPLLNLLGLKATTGTFSKGQGEVLSDIMMAQDFQDLSGQVIKKVIDIINRTELQLVNLLIDSAPEVTASENMPQPLPATVDTHKLDGPQTLDNALKQNDVDDLLASLGF